MTADRPAGDVPLALQCTRNRAVDILLVVDNSGGMSENQRNFVESFAPLVDALTGGDPATAVQDLRVGVISTDLGTSGAEVPSCANSASGDDGLLNPVRNGLAMRAHQPWTTAPPGRRPARCTTDRDQYPEFLSFNTGGGEASFREDLICNAYLSTGACGMEQPLEATYRALVTHNARGPAGGSPNGGFVRDDAVLGVMVLSDEEDGSVRDTRYTEAGFPARDATSVFNSLSPDWASKDLNLRFYLYTPGSPQDPTWPVDRYIDPLRSTRGYTSLKPGRPWLVVFGAITGVPIALPERSPDRVDWDRLLGRNPDGSDGYAGSSPEGPVSMRQRNVDPMCSTRVVPACRREGSTYNPNSCDSSTQYFAWPARRIAQVARRFDEAYNNSVIGSICRGDYSATVRAFADKIRGRICR